MSMHFEILVEDASGKIALESILGKILGPNGQDHTRSFQVFRDGIRKLTERP